MECFVSYSPTLTSARMPLISISYAYTHIHVHVLHISAHDVMWQLSHPERVCDIMAYMRLVVRKGYRHGDTGWLKYDCFSSETVRSHQCHGPVHHHGQQQLQPLPPPTTTAKSLTTVHMSMPLCLTSNLPGVSGRAEQGATCTYVPRLAIIYMHFQE